MRKRKGRLILAEKIMRNDRALMSWLESQHYDDEFDTHVSYAPKEECDAGKNMMVLQVKIGLFRLLRCDWVSPRAAAKDPGGRFIRVERPSQDELTMPQF